MDSLKAALERLDETLDVLERAVEERLAREAAGAEERQQLALALDQSRASEARTRQAAQTVSQRLDGAIERLQTVLED
ncbi:MAG TPA: DUF4164 family protein [Azospirillaceae bacterium]|nr:DUF4164 family protein [Azospirillaceae bacterium]